MAKVVVVRRKKRRGGRGLLWLLGLFFAWLFFGDYVGGPGGWWPGSGSGSEAESRAASRPSTAGAPDLRPTPARSSSPLAQIGRASCREGARTAAAAPPSK